MNRSGVGFLASVVGGILWMLAAVAIAAGASIATVFVGHPGNAGDSQVATDGTSGYGAVADRYRIGMIEVKNGQYAEFLNAVAASDPSFLNSGSRASDPRGGIVRSGSSGNYSYAIKAAALGQDPLGGDYVYDDKPVVFVSWHDALRFTNWLHNGQPIGAVGPGTTDNDAYNLSDASIASPRLAGARWFLPSENEWYKAAFYDGASGTYRKLLRRVVISLRMPICQMTIRTTRRIVSAAAPATH